MTQYRFLGYRLAPDAPGPPAIPAIQREPFLKIESDGANVTMLKLTSHTGTHLDTPYHVIPDGYNLSDFDAGDFVFTAPVVFDLPLDDCVVVQPEHLEPFIEAGQEADLLLFRFGYGGVRRDEPERFSGKCPGFGVESARFLRDNFPKMRGLGMDVPSLSCIEYLDETMEAHHVLLGGEGRRFIVIEDMNLDQDLSGLTTVIVAPLLVDQIDGGPCTVFGELSQQT
jgi:arylformamidase